MSLWIKFISGIAVASDRGETRTVCQITKITIHDISLHQEHPENGQSRPPDGSAQRAMENTVVRESPKPRQSAQWWRSLFAIIILTAIGISFGSASRAAELSPTVSSISPLVDLAADGSADWAHWGLNTATSVNRKTGVITQIGSIVTIGSAANRFQAPASVRSTYDWSDGTPTATASSTAGIYFGGSGNGFELTSPADTTTRTLKVYLGGFKASGQIEVSLSDGSVAPFVTMVEDLGGPFDRTLTVRYSAASAGQTLLVRYFLVSGSNVTLQAATLQGAVANVAPVLTPIGNKVATVDMELSFVVQATDTDGPSPLVLSHSALPQGAVFTPDAVIEGRGTFSWTPDVGDLPGPYSVKFTATEDSGTGLFDDETIQISVNPASGNGGSLMPAISGIASLIDLTSDGSTDWAHWGLSSSSSVNRKAGQASQISSIVTLGAAAKRFQAPAGVRATYDWSDGAPTAAASTTAGLYFGGSGNGYELTLPADTSPRTVQIHLGGYKSQGQIEVTLSDASALPFVATVENLGGAFDRTLTVSYTAASAGQTLLIRYTLVSGSNVTLQAATLQGVIANAPPTLTPIGDQSAAVDSELSFVVEATDPDGPAPLVLTHTILPPGAVFTPDAAIQGKGTFTWTPTSSDLPGPYSVTFTATENNGAGLFAEETVEFTVSSPSGGSGSLSPAVNSITRLIDLTSSGTADWAHWGLTTTNSVNRKAGVVAQISDIVTLGSSARRFQAPASVRTTYDWSDGSPTGSANTTAGLFFRGLGNGIEMTVPADTTSRTLRVHLGGYQARGQIEVTLSDGSAPPFVTTVEDLSGPFDRTLTVTYNAASSGQTLLVRYFLVSGSNVTLQAAELQGGGSALALPFSDDFADGDSTGWLFSNETPTSHAWSVASGELLQSNVVASVNSFSESYHLGTYAWMPAGTALTDYIFSASVARTDPARTNSLGILFRYKDQNNYYRLTINASQGFTRLEKRESGVFFTLARNAFGLDPATSSYVVEADVNGPDMRISIGGLLVLSASDSAHSTGTVGLFTQSPAAFDNVLIAPASSVSDIQIAQPSNLGVIPGSKVDVDLLVRNLPTGGSVEVSMQGQPAVVLNSAPWSTSFQGLTSGETTVTATLRDSNTNMVSQTVASLSVGGIYALAIGDSITNGDVDNFAADNDDAQRVSSDRAYASTLASLMEALPPTEVVIFNEGIGGDTADENDTLRLQSLLERHPNASDALVQFGTNDALAKVSAADFENSLQSIVSRLGADSITTYLATLPPILGGTDPLSSADNGRIDQYNSVINNNITGAILGADLWSIFAPDDTGDGVADRIRADLFADNLHPNALGHSIIAALWYNALLGDSTGTAIAPFFLDFISQSTYKQNLIESGDEYLVDSIATIQTIPAVLSNAVWLNTAQADVSNASASFVSFDVDRSATIYVAYDADATVLPDWLNPATSGFSATGLSIQTTQTGYTVYSRSVSAGNIFFGGNAAAGADGNDMFIVAVVAFP